MKQVIAAKFAEQPQCTRHGATSETTVKLSHALVLTTSLASFPILPCHQPCPPDTNNHPLKTSTGSLTSWGGGLHVPVMQLDSVEEGSPSPPPPLGRGRSCSTLGSKGGHLGSGDCIRASPTPVTVRPLRTSPGTLA